MKSLTWAFFVPLWQFPDEQAHFAHVAYLAEGEQLPLGRGNDLNQEIAISEKYLGTYRNKFGNNSFTYNPDFRLEYTGTYTGKYEKEIKNLPLSMRKDYRDPESAYYPHFFYRVSGLIYKLFYQQDIFVRVFALRIFWLFTHLLMVWLAYLIGKIIFPKDKLASLSVALLTSFQPMLSFVAAGLTSDNLHNLLFTAIIYFSLKIGRKMQLFDLLGLAIVMFLGWLNKPQFLVSLGLVVPLLLWQVFKTRKFILGLITAILTAIFGWTYFSGSLAYFEITQFARPDYSLWQHTIYTVTHTFREVLPWYWGVFRWLSLTLPRWVNQVMMRLLLIAGVGLIIKLIRRKFEPGFWLIVWSALIYFLALFFWDWQQVRNAGFPFGIQGRYYFPVIVPHMVLLVMGIKELFPRITYYLLLITNYWFIALNWLAFYWVTSSYYSTVGFNQFIMQASQYKPVFAKGIWLICSLAVYAILTIIFSIKLIRYEK